MRKTVSILGTDYSKSALDKRWKEIVNSNGVNLLLRGSTEEFIRATISLVPRWKTLGARESVKFKIRNRKFQGRAVKGVTIIDTAKEVWVGKGQLLEALFPAPEVSVQKNNKKAALAAMRLIIEPQVKSFRASVLRQLDKKPVRCKISHDFLEKGKFHVDHKYPFKRLVEDFCIEYKVDLEYVETYCKGTKCYLRDISLAESWSDYHLTNSELQAVNSVVNLQKGAKYYG